VAESKLQKSGGIIKKIDITPETLKTLDAADDTQVGWYLRTEFFEVTATATTMNE
jgi:hypothetical protein